MLIFTLDRRAWMGECNLSLVENVEKFKTALDARKKYATIYVSNHYIA
jgi:hypothetical protein